MPKKLLDQVWHFRLQLLDRWRHSPLLNNIHVIVTPLSVYAFSVHMLSRPERQSAWVWHWNGKMGYIARCHIHKKWHFSTAALEILYQLTVDHGLKVETPPPPPPGYFLLTLLCTKLLSGGLQIFYAYRVTRGQQSMVSLTLTCRCV